MRKGFTLIELLVVLLFIFVLFGLLLPVFHWAEIGSGSPADKNKIVYQNIERIMIHTASHYRIIITENKVTKYIDLPGLAHVDTYIDLQDSGSNWAELETNSRELTIHVRNMSDITIADLVAHIEEGEEEND